MIMKLEDFDFHLPEELIAQHPLEKRDSSRLLVLDKKNGELEDRLFTDLVDYLMPGDVLVINNTKVIPARLIGSKKGTGAKVEVFLLSPSSEIDTWEVLVKPGKKVK